MLGVPGPTWLGPACSAFDAITIHLVLSGQGTLRVGTGPGLPSGAHTILVVAAHQPHGLAEVTRPGLGTQAMTEG